MRARLQGQYALPDVFDGTAEADGTIPLTQPLQTQGQRPLFNPFDDAVECPKCGGRMIRAGSCYACRDCGDTTGCG